MTREEIQEYVKQYLELVPEFGAVRVEYLLRYILQNKLDKEFIDEISRCIAPSTERELKYMWDIQEKESR